ncbi:MAG: hypothetical protein M1823_001442 [Watsoniomyces obsoletus]|nr:MAG: hypothetical protein M1823_001442 [Watsoniomyces obsoletus]
MAMGDTGKDMDKNVDQDEDKDKDKDDENGEDKDENNPSDGDNDKEEDVVAYPITERSKPKANSKKDQGPTNKGGSSLVEDVPESRKKRSTPLPTTKARQKVVQPALEDDDLEEIEEIDYKTREIHADGMADTIQERWYGIQMRQQDRAGNRSDNLYGANSPSPTRTRSSVESPMVGQSPWASRVPSTQGQHPGPSSLVREPIQRRSEVRPGISMPRATVTIDSSEPIDIQMFVVLDLGFSRGHHIASRRLKDKRSGTCGETGADGGPTASKGGD